MSVLRIMSVEDRALCFLSTKHPEHHESRCEYGPLMCKVLKKEFQDLRD